MCLVTAPADEPEEEQQPVAIAPFLESFSLCTGACIEPDPICNASDSLPWFPGISRQVLGSSVRKSECFKAALLPPREEPFQRQFLGYFLLLTSWPLIDHHSVESLLLNVFLAS